LGLTDRLGQRAVGGPPRHMHREAVLIHAEDDAPPFGAALEGVLHHPAAQDRHARLGEPLRRLKEIQRGASHAALRPFPSLTTSASIQSSTALFKASARMPAGSMGRPMLTVILPGYLRKECRGHIWPALCATGTAGAPVLTASQAPPSWYGPRSPGGKR